MGFGNWGAYLMACTYYLSEEIGIGTDICEFFGYGYWVIDQMKVLVDFMPKDDGSGNNPLSAVADIGKLASGEALDGALNSALKAFDKTESAAEEV